MPDEHKPNDEWIAARLKIKHEFRTRLATGVQRRLKRELKHGAYSMGDEVWMHVKPSKEELRRWRKRNRCALGKDDDGSDTAVEDGREEVGGGADVEQDVGGGAGREEGAQETSTEPITDGQETWLGEHPALKKEESTGDDQPSIPRR